MRRCHELKTFADRTNALSHLSVSSFEVDPEEAADSSGKSSVQKISVRVLR
ncbi:MAG: hypothetical protein NXH85_03750 [Pseudomonadaceae bacterium]|nr:hypothetical protein [Pseudomonadaceae bacterium]